MPIATSPKQRRYLRSLAHDLEPVVQVGNDGVTEGVVGATARALLDHELIKVRLREPEDKKGMSRQLADATDSVLCGLVGHTVILFKPRPEKPAIQLPRD